MSRWRKQEQVRRGPVGMDVGRDEVRLVQLAVERGRTHVLALASCPTPPEAFSAAGAPLVAPVLVDRLRTLVEQYGWLGADCVVAAAGPRLVAAEVALAGEGTPEHQAREALARRLTYPVSEALVGCEVLPGGGAALVWALPAAAVSGAVALAEAAGLAPVVAEFAPFALAWSQVDSAAGRGCWLALDLGAAHTSATLLLHGEVAASTARPGGGRELTTDLARRLEYDLPAAEALKRDAAAWSPESASVEPAVRAAMHQALARCVEQLVTDVRQAGAVDGVLLHGGGALLAGLREALAVASGVRVVVADPFAGLGVAREALPPRAVATAPAWALAWGLAARGLAE